MYGCTYVHIYTYKLYTYMLYHDKNQLCKWCLQEPASREPESSQASSSATQPTQPTQPTSSAATQSESSQATSPLPGPSSAPPASAPPATKPPSDAQDVGDAKEPEGQISVKFCYKLIPLFIVKCYVFVNHIMMYFVSYKTICVIDIQSQWLGVISL